MRITRSAALVFTRLAILAGVAASYLLIGLPGATAYLIGLVAGIIIAFLKTTTFWRPEP